MGPRHSRLAAALAAAWEAEVVSARRLSSFAERCADGTARAKLLVLSAFSRAHASRILARLAALGRGPLPVPPQEESEGAPDDLLTALRREVTLCRVAASRYEAMAELARSMSDLSSAWVCELNRTEEEDLVLDLARLVERGITDRDESVAGG